MRYLYVGGFALTCAAVLALVGSLIAGLQRDVPAGASAEPAVAGARVRVEVLNAAREGGLARTATQQLRDAGFDVVYYGNASGFAPDSSIVFDRIGRIEQARRVGDALHIHRVRSAADSTLFVDVSVVLGRDWKGRSQRPAAAAHRAAI